MTCMSVRSKKTPGERCTNKAIGGSDWCGKHRDTRIAFAAETIEVCVDDVRTDVLGPGQDEAKKAVTTIRNAWLYWIAKRAGPLLYNKSESNNPYDFFSSDPIEEIPYRDFVSFVDAGKGYCMDIKSATSLLQHAVTNKEPALNPFNRAPLPPVFLRRIRRHVGVKAWASLEGTTEIQKQTLATTDIFRKLEDLGNYTNPDWFIGLSHLQLQQLYLELADIWFHRATLSPEDRCRIVPAPHSAFTVPVRTALIMRPRALRPLLIKTCDTLVSAAESRGDRQLGGMYILGALAMISAECAGAFPWLTDMFSPGVTRATVDQMGRAQLLVLHASVLAY